MVLAAQFTARDIDQACVTLLILNVKSSHTRPWVLLTDLDNEFAFFWMDGRVMYSYFAEDGYHGWSIIMDLLQHDANVTLAKPGKTAAKRVPILARKAIPEELTMPRDAIRRCR